MLNTWEEVGVTEGFNWRETEWRKVLWKYCSGPPRAWQMIWGGGGERLGLEQWARRLRWGGRGGRLTFKPGRKDVEGKGVLLLKVDL